MPEQTPPSAATPASAPAPAPLKEFVPAELHDRGYLKDLLDRPWDKETAGLVFKKLDGAESLIGKKMLIPGADAKPEDWDGFLEKLRPGKPEEYEIAVNDKADKDFVGALRAAAHAGGFSKMQFDRFIGKLAPFLAEREAALSADRKKQDADFDKLVADTFSDKGKEKLERARSILKEHTPPNLLGFVDRLDNNGLAILAGFVDNFATKYMSEDDLRGTGKGVGSGGTDPEALRTEAKTLMASAEYKDVTHAKHEEVVRRVQELYEQYALTQK